MSEIDWAAIGAKLQAPFPPHQVKQKAGRGGKTLSYIDARAVAARLDDAVGPGGWAFSWEPMVIGRPERLKLRGGELAPEPEVDAVLVVKGILTIHGVSKCDIGAAGPVEPNKASISNALRRCGALWGIGRDLYGEQAAAPQAQQVQRPPQQLQRPIQQPSQRTERPATPSGVPSPASGQAAASAPRVVAAAGDATAPAPGEMPAPLGDRKTQIRNRVLATVQADPYNWTRPEIVQALQTHARRDLQTANEAGAEDWAKLEAAIQRLGLEALPSVAAYAALAAAGAA